MAIELQAQQERNQHVEQLNRQRYELQAERDRAEGDRQVT
jgi:hypothetical protein